MGYIGKVPADVLIDPHVDSASIVDSTIVTADIANDAVTSAKLAQNSVDSSELIDGSVDNSHLAGSIAMNKTLLSAGTGLTLSTNTLNVDAAQTQITSVGTIGTGVWQGTKVASAYLDDDTAHLSGSTFTGAVQVNNNNLTAKMTTAGAGIRSIVDRVDTSDYAGFEVRTGGNQRWFIGAREDSTDNLQFYNGGSSGTVQNVLTLNHSDSSATFAGELRVNGGQASIYGAEGADSILELNSDEADDNADRWQMYVFNTNNYLKWRHYSTGSWVDRLWLSSATDNWAMNLTANSPYGMQITTASDSASTDAFGIRRNSSAKVFEVLNNGKILCTRQLHIDTDSASVYPSIVGETSNYELFRLEQWHGNEGSLVLKRDGSNKIRLTGGQSGVVSFIDNGSNFCFGRQTALSPAGRVTIASALDGGTTPACSFQANTNTGSGAVVVFHAGDGSEEGNVFMSNLNAGTGVSYNSSSDYRLKEKVKTLPNGLDRVNQMKPVEFVWKKAKIKSEGFLAHELQEICDYAVSGEKDGDRMQQADYAKITPILVKAVQELSAEVEKLKGN